MKKSFLLALLPGASCFSARSQTNYHYYFDSTSLLKYYSFDAGAFGGDIKYYTYYFDGDSLVGGNWYYRRFVRILDSNFSWNGSITATILQYFLSFVREDTTHKIWHLDLATGNDVLENDWGNMPSKGDTFQYYANTNCIVTYVDSIYLGSMPLKRVRPADNIDSMTFTRGYVEGVAYTGAACGIGYHGDGYYVCYYKQGNSVLLSHVIPCGAFPAPIYTHHYGDSGTHEVYVLPLARAGSLRVFPNPAGREIQVTWPEAGSFDLLVTDLLGRKLILQKCSGGMIRLDVSGLSAGLYFLNLGNGAVSEYGQFVKE